MTSPAKLSVAGSTPGAAPLAAGDGASLAPQALADHPRLRRALALLRHARSLLEALQPAAQLAARLYVARVFFLSGLTKVRDWDSTLFLFREEYHVPLLPPELAAVMGSAGELLLPPLLLLGLGGRFAALGLSVVNVMAALSLADIPEPALNLHVFWGSLLLALALWGPGRWSADRLWAPRWLGG